MYWKTIFFISHPKHVVGTQKNRLNETVLLSTQKHMFKLTDNKIITIRRMAENGFAPIPLGNFADISYLVEN